MAVTDRLAYAYLRKKGFDKSLFYFNYADRIFNTSSTKYNLCCFYSLTGDKTKALDFLEQAFIKKFDNYEHIQKDTDLDPIRKEPHFEELLKKYFPDKFK